MRAVVVIVALSGCGRIGFDNLVDATATLPGGVPAIWYRTDETSGTILHDSGLQGADASLTGTFAFTGTGVSFPAAAGYAMTAPLPGVFRTYPLTISVWARPAPRSDETANTFALLPFPPDAVSNDVPGFGGAGVGVDVWTDGVPGSHAYVDSGGDYEGAPFVANQRYHLVAVYDGTQASLYVDGALATGLTTTALDGAAANLFVGAHNLDTGYGSKRFFVGELSDVRVFTAALSAQDVAQLHALGAI
jgi:hypothetical protein